VVPKWYPGQTVGGLIAPVSKTTFVDWKLASIIINIFIGGGETESCMKNCCRIQIALKTKK
jgi:hypothetical protein